MQLQTTQTRFRRQATDRRSREAAGQGGSDGRSRLYKVVELVGSSTGKSAIRDLTTDPWGLRPLTNCEKQKLSPYIPDVDLNNADLHTDEVPGWLKSDATAVTLGNNIYIRPSRYDASTPEGLSLLGHELVHVGQFRGGMTVLGYMFEAALHGSGRSNKYEDPAYDLQDKIFRDLEKEYGNDCGCRNP